MRRGLILAAICGLASFGSGQSALASGPDEALLTNTAISLAAATGERATEVTTAGCPFVSDATMIASVRTSFEIKRRTASATACRWSYNAGFAIDVTIEDLATAKPITERRYNIGIDPVLSPQDGPGSSAVLLNDTAWDKPLPYAYSFEKDGKLIFMRYTGLKINVGKMRRAAKEIARRMGENTTAMPRNSEPAAVFAPCETWTRQDLRSVFGASASASIEPGRRGASTCSWDIFQDGISGRRTAAFNIHQPEQGRKQEYEYSSYSPYGENGETHYLRKSESSFGLYIHLVTPRPGAIVHTTVSDPNGDATAQAKRLHYNLLSRLVP